PAPWLTSYDAAKKEAARSGRPILVDLYAAWCGWCKVLDTNVFPSARFQQFARDYVLLRLDTEDGGDGSALNARYDVESLPTTLVLDGNGVLQGKIDGYFPTDEYIGAIQSELKSFKEYVGRVESAAAGADVNAQKAAAAEAHLRSDGPHAAALYRKLATSG